DHFEYRVLEKAIDRLEQVSDSEKTATTENALVSFCTVEKADEKNPKNVARNAVNSIQEVADWVKTKRIVIYPYAHLSSSLASRDIAIQILKSIETDLALKEYNVTRSPFGWYKSFKIECKGHPLSELSRSITSEGEPPKESQVKVEYAILDLDGQVYDPKTYVFKPGEDDLKMLVEKEAFKTGLIGGKPRFLDYCRKFGLEWEPYSDVGHMRYEPEANVMFELVADYSWTVANSLDMPIFAVRGTNMFDLSVKPVKEHAELFGARLYQVNIDEKSYVLRYAACHQQFAMLKDWAISYRHLPFGTFEVADSYRLEQSGELLLCFRVRKLHMPDLHIFCRDVEEAKIAAMKTHRKIYEEIGKLGRDYVSIYNTTKSFYEQNKVFFEELLAVERKPVLLSFVPESVYYWVINVEYTIIDELGRPREIATFQIDIGNAKRFDISYTDTDGRKQHPPVIHTALIGTVERYIFAALDTAVKLEKDGKVPRLPLWLTPVQVRLIPVNSSLIQYANNLMSEIEEANIRVDLDDRSESLAKRIRDAEMNWVPYIAVIGQKEVETRLLNVRKRETGEQTSVSTVDMIREIAERTKGYPHTRLKMPRLLSQRPVYKP
ncbi:threonine--tRNA ligase, partial [Candidatus Bathyarchaeota archaeon]|nr:threonine--tRNA ligase [Candidatus Bathyarchaeota archaeon]